MQRSMSMHTPHIRGKNSSLLATTVLTRPYRLKAQSELQLRMLVRSASHVVFSIHTARISRCAAGHLLTRPKVTAGGDKASSEQSAQSSSPREPAVPSLPTAPAVSQHPNHNENVGNLPSPTAPTGNENGEADSGIEGSPGDRPVPMLANEESVTDVDPALADTNIMPEPTTAVSVARQFIRENPIAGYSILSIIGFLGITFIIAVIKTAAKGMSPSGKRGRTVNKNKTVVEEIGKYLPSNRSGLNGGVIVGLRLKTGFSPVEIFRKYLWFLLRERKFDQDAIDDLVALKSILDLSDTDVAEALKERAKRVYEQFGNVMLDTTGMSNAGIERKATARALFSKLLYIVECESILSPEIAATVDLRDVFGATEDDAAKLRIASLYEVDLNAALDLPSANEQSGWGEEDAPST